MLIDRFGGDPKLYLAPDGSKLIYKSGQPVMDQGLENITLIDLFTKDGGENRNINGWWGNLLVSDPVKKIGSSYQSTIISAPINLQKLTDLEKITAKTLADKVYGDIESEVTNPESNRIENNITIKSPGKDIKLLLITDNFVNWKAQALAPAYKNI